MQQYFYSRFPIHVQHLAYRAAGDAGQPDVPDDKVLYFGAGHWANVDADLSPIPMTDRPQFLLSLFMLVLVDQTMQARFPDAYARWRQLSYIPRFGPAGAGRTDDSPYDLLWIPERESLVDAEFALIFVNEFAEFMVEQVSQFLGEVLPDVPVHRFFALLVDDPRAGACRGVFATAVRQELAHVWQQRLRRVA